MDATQEKRRAPSLQGKGREATDHQPMMESTLQPQRRSKGKRCHLLLLLQCWFLLDGSPSRITLCAASYIQTSNADNGNNIQTDSNYYSAMTLQYVDAPDTPRRLKMKMKQKKQEPHQQEEEEEEEENEEEPLFVADHWPQQQEEDEEEEEEGPLFVADHWVAYKGKGKMRHSKSMMMKKSSKGKMGMSSMSSKGMMGMSTMMSSKKMMEKSSKSFVAKGTKGKGWKRTENKGSWNRKTTCRPRGSSKSSGMMMMKGSSNRGKRMKLKSSILVMADFSAVSQKNPVVLYNAKEQGLAVRVNLQLPPAIPVKVMVTYRTVEVGDWCPHDGKPFVWHRTLLTEPSAITVCHAKTDRVMGVLYQAFGRHPSLPSHFVSVSVDASHASTDKPVTSNISYGPVAHVDDPFVLILGGNLAFVKCPVPASTSEGAIRRRELSAAIGDACPVKKPGAARLLPDPCFPYTTYVVEDTEDFQIVGCNHYGIVVSTVDMDYEDATGPTTAPFTLAPTTLRPTGPPVTSAPSQVPTFQPTRASMTSFPTRTPGTTSVPTGSPPSLATGQPTSQPVTSAPVDPGSAPPSGSQTPSGSPSQIPSLSQIPTQNATALPV